jgi:hypothetical protein
LPPRHNDKSDTLGKMEVSPFLKNLPRGVSLRFFGAEFLQKTLKAIFHRIVENRLF